MKKPTKLKGKKCRICFIFDCIDKKGQTVSAAKVTPRVQN